MFTSVVETGRNILDLNDSDKLFFTQDSSKCDKQMCEQGIACTYYIYLTNPYIYERFDVANYFVVTKMALATSYIALSMPLRLRHERSPIIIALAQRTGDEGNYLIIILTAFL